MQVTKFVQDGAIYSRTEYENGAIVVEKRDPRIGHDAPAEVMSGAAVIVTFRILDFDEEVRSDSGGMLRLDIEGTDINVPIVNGIGVLSLELHDSATIRHRPPYFCDATFTEFTIEVTL
jgi:hypothetical protein